MIPDRRDFGGGGVEATTAVYSVPRQNTSALQSEAFKDGLDSGSTRRGVFSPPHSD